MWDLDAPPRASSSMDHSAGSDGAAAAATTDASSSSSSSATSAASTAGDVDESPAPLVKTPPRVFPPRSELAPVQTSAKHAAAARIGTGRRFGVLPPTAVARLGGSASATATSSGEKRPRPAMATIMERKRPRAQDSRDFNPRTSHRGYCLFYRASLSTLTLPLASSNAGGTSRKRSSLNLKGAIGLLKSAGSST